MNENVESKIVKQMVKKNTGFTLVEVIAVLVILAFLTAITVPLIVGYIDKAKETKAIAEARNVQLAASTSIVEWNGYQPRATPGTIPYRKEQQIFMKPLMSSECGMTREDYDCYGNNTFTTLTTTNNVGWANMLNKSRGTNRATVFLNKERTEVVGIFYVTKDGNYAVRIIITPWKSANNAPEVATAGIFVEKTN